MENILEYTGTGDHFLNITQTLTVAINKWDLMKLRSFCKANHTVVKTNHSLQNGKDLHQPHILQGTDFQSI